MKTVLLVACLVLAAAWSPSSEPSAVAVPPGPVAVQPASAASAGPVAAPRPAHAEQPAPADTVQPAAQPAAQPASQPAAPTAAASTSTAGAVPPADDATADDDTADDDTADDDTADDATADDAPPPGLRLSLSDAEPRPDDEGPAAPPATTPLDEADTAALLDRAPGLEPLPEPPAFSFPTDSRPAPRTGAVVDQPPLGPGTLAGSRPVAPEAEALTLLRFSPEGEVPLSDHLSLTFSQPMVPVGAVGELAERVPVRLEPPTPGSWRWAGTRTLVFEARPRLPMATHFELTVPAGTTSAVGGRLEQALRLRCSTPAPTLVSALPRGESVPREPLLALAFDQDVDPATVATHARLVDPGWLGDDVLPVRLATAAERAADTPLAAGVRALVEQHGASRVVVLAPREPLPYHTALELRLPPGLASREGPRVTEQAQQHDFAVHGPFELVERNGTAREPMNFRAQLVMTFSNPIDPASLDGLEVAVEPSLADQRLYVQAERQLVIAGDWRGHASRRVTIGAGLTDVFGQRHDQLDLTVFVEARHPAFVLQDQLVVLDPGAPPYLSLPSVNVDELEVAAASVSIGDWPSFRGLVRAGQAEGWGNARFSRTTTLEPGGSRDEFLVCDIGLAELLPGGLGHVVVRVQADEVDDEPRYQWLQRTRLGLHVAVDDGEALAWVTDLSTGAPVEGAEVMLSMGDGSVRTDAGGLATLPLPAEDDGSQILVARLGDDVAFLPDSHWRWSWNRSGDWTVEQTEPRPLYYVFDDRGTYKPGERVRVKGWVRQVLPGEGGGTRALPAGEHELRWLLRDARRNELASGRLTLDRFGAFSLALDLPADVNLGHAQLRLTLDGEDPLHQAQFVHRLLVAEYRLPEYEVSVSAEPGVVVLGDRAVFAASARYYTGGGLPDTPVAWTLSARPASWTAPGWNGFQFGTSGGGVPWRGGGADPGGPWTHAGSTDVEGVHRLAVELLGQDTPRALTLSAEAAVTDVNRQRWAASGSLLVHPAAVAVGLDLQRGFVEPGEPVPLRLIVTDLDGTPSPAREVALAAVRKTWVRDEHGWSETDGERVEVAATSGLEPVDATLVLPRGGRWELSARVVDDARRSHVSSVSLWVAGAATHGEDSLRLQDVVLVPDKDSYAVGETARVLVVAPFADAEGLLTVMRSGVIASERFTIDGTSHVLELPLGAEHTPGLHLGVELVGRSPRLAADGSPRADGLQRPAFASGQVQLDVPPAGSRLTVDVVPDAASLLPGSETAVTVTVTGADGAPVRDAQVALAVVDEAVLALTGHEVADPLGVLHPPRSDRTSEARSRSLLRLADPDVLLYEAFGKSPLPGASRSLSSSEAGELGVQDFGVNASAMAALGYSGGADAAPMVRGMSGRARSAVGFAASAPAAAAYDDYDGVDAEAGGAPADPVRERARFDVLAAWRPAEVTDAQGQVRVALTLPDNLTRYRVLAVALDAVDRGGLGEAGLTARLPLMVRPSPPRFLNVGDRCELPVVVQNGGDEPLTVDVALDVVGLVLEQSAARRVTVAAGERVELRWPVRAERPGEARLAVIAAARDGTPADAARVSFPVRTPASAEAFATYGQLVGDAVAAQPVLAPGGALPGFGALEISTSTTALSELADAALYLTDETTYGCAEQRASRVLAATALADVLAAFGTVDPVQLETRVAEDVAHLVALQNGDGGFPLWSPGHPSVPFASVHVTHALQAAANAGLEVPGQVLLNAWGYTRQVDRHLRALPYPPSERTQRTVRAYALWVEQLTSHGMAGRALDLATGSPPDELSLDAKAWLLPLLGDDASSRRAAEALRADLAQRLVETASGSHLAADVDERDGHVVYASARRTDALYLDALLRTGGDDDLVTKLVRGLLGHRVEGRWRTTQECVFALLALGRYFERFEADAPSLEVGAWLDERLVGEVDHRGRSVDTTRLSLPLSLLDGDGPTELLLASAGTGRLYYRVGLRYAPADPLVPPTSQGFVVERSYEALDDPADVRRDDDGVWHIAAGASVRVRLTLVAGGDRHHVALVDRLPAGLEILNPGLAVTGSVPDDEADPEPVDFWRCWWWGRPWYEHSNLRDDRAEAFASDLHAGVHHFTYVARATTPGTYLAPAPRAEEMYAPETFGRGPTDRVIITP